MSGNDDQETGGSVVNFPRVFIPGSFDAPAPSEHAPTGDDSDQAPPVGKMPRLPGVASMAPPLVLTMPRVPTPDDKAAADDDGSFDLPVLGDPDNPTARGTLAVAVALMTALGVAAAQGMWHRARHRSALADQSRAAADKTRAAAAGGRTSRSAGTSGGSGSLLRSPSGGGGSKGSRAFGDHRSTGRSGKTRPPGADAAHGPHRPHKRDKGAKGSAVVPKAERGGKPTKDPQSKPSKVKGGAAGTTGKPKQPKPSAAPVPKLTWKAPKGGRVAKGPKRWAGRNVPTAKRPRTKGKATWKATKNGKGTKRWTPKAKTPPSSTRAARPSNSRPRKTWKAKPKNRATKGGTKTQKTWKASSGSTSGTHAGHGKHKATSTPPPPPPPGFEGMRPPPGADQTARVTVERVGNQPKPQRTPKALTQEGTRSMPVLEPSAMPSTQYGDADLTIFDVIDADADMAAEIVDGVTEAHGAAEGCDLLLTRLEAMHAKVVELRVPGVLEGLVVALMEKTGTVKARADAIGANLPRAAEAISVAGSNAEARHRPLADAVRDAGHIRPAERNYHNE